MNIKENFKISLKQQEILRHKIYKILDEFYFCCENKEFSPHLELPLYNSDINMLGSIVVECIKEIGLPVAFIYQKNPLSQYFEYDPNNILTVVQFADILIDLLIKYQVQLQKFKALPLDKQEKCYNKIYKIIKQNLPVNPPPFFPDIIINIDNYRLSKLKAKKTVMQSAVIMGLNKKDVCRYFEEERYFRFSTFLRNLYLVLLPFILIFHIINLIITKKWEFDYFFYQSLKPITAKKFADIIIELWLMKHIT